MAYAKEEETQKMKRNEMNYTVIQSQIIKL